MNFPGRGSVLNGHCIKGFEAFIVGLPFRYYLRVFWVVQRFYGG